MPENRISIFFLFSYFVVDLLIRQGCGIGKEPIASCSWVTPFGVSFPPRGPVHRRVYPGPVSVFVHHGQRPCFHGIGQGTVDDNPPPLFPLLPQLGLPPKRSPSISRTTFRCTFGSDWSNFKRTKSSISRSETRVFDFKFSDTKSKYEIYLQWFLKI